MTGCCPFRRHLEATSKLTPLEPLFHLRNPTRTANLAYILLDTAPSRA